MRWRSRGRVLTPPVADGWGVSHAALPTVEALDGDIATILFAARDGEGRSSIGRARVSLADGTGGATAASSSLRSTATVRRSSRMLRLPTSSAERRASSAAAGSRCRTWRALVTWSITAASPCPTKS